MEEFLRVASALGTADRAGRDACLSTSSATSEPLDDVTGALSGWPEGSEQLTVIRQALAGMASAGTEAEAIDRIRVLESLKSTCAALQAREAVSLDGLRRAREADEGVPADQRGRGVGGEVALARREPAQRGGRHIGLARALCQEMPNTLRALTDGEISEEHATAMARETAWLPVEHRRAVDALMSCRLGPIGVKKLAAEARAHAQRLDQESAVAHLERCTAERRVSVRPATGGMAYLTALLPMPQAVAVFANLHRDASTAVGVGDTAGRTRDQIMADLLVERTTGQHSAPAIPTEIHLVMTDATLLAGDPTSGWCPWTRRPGCSLRYCAGCSSCGMTSAAPHGARRPSGTPIMRSPIATAVRPAMPMARDCARGATTPRNTPVGVTRPPLTGWTSSPPPVTAMRTGHRPSSAECIDLVMRDRCPQMPPKRVPLPSCPVGTPRGRWRGSPWRLPWPGLTTGWNSVE